MKLNYFLKSFALVALIAVFTNAKAADIHVADGATDTELAIALEQAQTGDVILIDGWVTINAMVHVTKNVTIKAGVSIAGFDGGGNSRLFEIHPEPVDGAKLVFENLDFTGGNGWQSAVDAPTDGGVARIYAGVTEFIGCYFYDNQAKRGGVFIITENGTTVSFKNCEAFDNVVYGGGDESRGGYLFADGETHISHDHCKITSNQAIGGRGGALCIFGNGTHYYYYTLIGNNKAGNWSEDGTQKLDKDGNVISSGEYEGGVAFITGGGITFESCAFVANESWSHSGIIRGMGDNTNVTFINTTMAQNWSRHDQAPIWNTGGTWTFVNTILADNKGSNSGNGGVFRGGDNKTTLNVFNSVWVRNILDSGEGAQDLTGDLDKVTIKNSIIGLINGDASKITVSDNANIPTKSILNMYKLNSGDVAQPDYAVLENSGIDFGQGVRYSKWGTAYYLLTPGTTITKLGDPALLANCEVNTDLFGRTRTPAADGSISAAPTLVGTEEDFDDSRLGIINPALAQKDNIRIIGTVENGILAVDFGNLKGQATGELISLTGQVVENVFNAVVVGKGYYNVNAAPGIYLLRVTSGGKTYVQKVIVEK
jgi:hypothetical protein